MNQIAIDKRRCRTCSLCVLDCPRSALALTEGLPVMAAPERCIACGHCMAVCPFAALSLNGADPEELPEPGEMPRYEEVKTFLEMRRSHRRFRAKNVDAVVIDGLLDSLRTVPTGNNFRRLHYTVINDLEVMAELRRSIHAKLLKVKEVPAMLQSTVQEIEAGGDPIFRTAPHLVVVSHHREAPTGLVDAVIALTHFELLAQSRGLGTLWFGRILTIMNNALPEIPEMLQIPAEYKIGYAMLFGESVCRYYRGVEALPVLRRILSGIGSNER